MDIKGQPCILMMGRLQEPVTSVVLANNTALDVSTTVPAGKRWILLQVKMGNPDNVSRNLTIDIFKEAALTSRLFSLIVVMACSAAAERQWPNSSTGNVSGLYLACLVILEAGNTIHTQWAAGGASTGGTDADGLVITYIELDAVVT